MGLHGEFRPPGDKSISHRVALFSLLARGRCEVSGYSDCADCASTLAAVRVLGGGAARSGAVLQLRGAAGKLVPSATIDCGNSGTTMRLLSGILAGRPGQYRLDGDESLRRRPMERVAIPLRQMGAEIESRGGLPPLDIRGGDLRGIEYAMPVASAQLKSALLLAGLQAVGETRLIEPAPSRDHTERMLQAWGASLRREANGVSIEPGALTLPASFVVPGDVSGAAFFICGALLSPDSSVLARDVLLNPSRTGWIEVLRRMGAEITVRELAADPEPMGLIEARTSALLHGIEVGAGEIPNIVDEIPILALVACQARGRTVFRNAGELRVKESDRLSAIVRELGRLGATLRVEGDDLVIDGPCCLRAPAEPLDSYGDHRIAMALRIASLVTAGELRIRDEACAAVSYPTFAETFVRLAAGAGNHHP